MSKRFSVQVDGVMVLVGVGVVGGLYLWGKLPSLNKINPFHQDNVINQAAEKHSIKGEHNGYSYDTHLFAAVDLLNPWNEDDSYAEKVWGIGE